MDKKFDYIKLVADYARGLKSQFKIDKVILFGSAVSGKMNYHSDLDVIIISSDFKNIEFIKRLQLLTIARRADARKIPMDIVGYTPNEFENLAKESAVVSEAKEKGKEIDF